MFDAIYPWPAKYKERVMGRATSCNRLQRIVRDPRNLKRATSCNQLHRIIRDPRNLKSHELQPAATHHPRPAKFKEPWAATGFNASSSSKQIWLKAKRRSWWLTSFHVHFKIVCVHFALLCFNIKYLCTHLEDFSLFKIAMPNTYFPNSQYPFLY